MPVTTNIDVSALVQQGRTLIIHPYEAEDPNALFTELCRIDALEHFRIEQDAEGNISIMAPTGGESSYQNTKITAQLDRWQNKTDKGNRSNQTSCSFYRMDQNEVLTPRGSAMNA